MTLLATIKLCLNAKAHAEVDNVGSAQRILEVLLENLEAIKIHRDDCINYPVSVTSDLPDPFSQ
jgi:hypothetical protein